MNEKYSRPPRDLGPHQHAHTAPTTQQMRTVGQRRREAEEKLEHHLDEARHKGERHEETEAENANHDQPDTGKH